MKELLDRLKQSEPTTYENIANCLAWAEVQWKELYPEYEGDKPYIPEDAEISTPMEYLIQGALQDAILTKGWHFQQMAREGRCMVDITVFEPECDIIDGPERKTPAEAMLAAYIAAISLER